MPIVLSHLKTDRSTEQFVIKLTTSAFFRQVPLLDIVYIGEAEGMRRE
jgi:hypothetical protein